MKTLTSLLIGTSLLSSLVLPVQAYRYDETTRRSSNIEVAANPLNLDCINQYRDVITTDCINFLIRSGYMKDTNEFCSDFYRTEDDLKTQFYTGTTYRLYLQDGRVLDVCVPN